MVMAQPVPGDGEPEVTFLPEEVLAQYLPVGSAVAIAPIRQCNDFFNLRRLFAEVDEGQHGAINVAETSELMERETGAAPSEAKVAALFAAADHGRMSFEAFRGACFYRARMRARIEQLGVRAAARVQTMHNSPPWHGSASWQAMLAACQRS
eukprot:3003665-Prymnesium_polylepis.1